MKNELIERIKDRIIDCDFTLLNALKQMDTIGKKLLFVYHGEKFINILSIGDVQRAILDNKSLDSKVIEILRKTTTLGYSNESFKELKDKMLKYRSECMPIINNEGELVDIMFWEDVFDINKKIKDINLNLPVVIMAGGKGTRLKPITNVLPKALIPIGEKTIIEEIMDRFVEVGCHSFYISINHKGIMIKHYLDNLNNTSYDIEYFQEEKPLGTAGSMYLIKNEIHTTFFVSNCDIIIDQDYDDIYKYHKENKNDITIVAALKSFRIPYGTIKAKEGGELLSLSEKPELTFMINSGMYLLEPHLLNEIPENDFFHITDLIEMIKYRKGTIGVFPVSEKSWKDFGDLNNYSEVIKSFGNQ